MSRVSVEELNTEQPRTAEELAETLACAAGQQKTIELGGNFTKRSGAGPAGPGDVTISTSRLNRILAYEPRDLTISVEAGITYAELTRALTPNRQMIPLDPPYSEKATIGGIVASNSSGPRRRLYGSARDMVIGMKFATLEGKLVQSGGMVVKNVAGLDMGKLMIGSWGTLAALASVNFKLQPIPAVERTLLLPVESPAAAFSIRDQMIQGVLQPSAIDFLNLRAASDLGYKQALLALEFGGNEGVIARSRRETAQWGQVIEPSTEESLVFWSRVRNFTPKYLQKFAGAVVLRISSTLSSLREVVESLEGPVIARAGSGVVYAYFSLAKTAAKWIADHPKWTTVIEYAPVADKKSLTLWPSPGSDIEIMKRVKNMFDPRNLLNRGRYYSLF
ncbi:MAG TPA: FAD-binding oxidoreductase [Bryobacteraceae bacterium]